MVMCVELDRCSLKSTPAKAIVIGLALPPLFLRNGTGSTTNIQPFKFGVYNNIELEVVAPWPNGQGVGPLIRRLRVQVPQGV